ncbi:MAG: hypothetical protein FWE16_05235, partial [Firmicutes bacterium]|nr:hypothetical protein [Bacillota bacterium]
MKLRKKSIIIATIAILLCTIMFFMSAPPSAINTLAATVQENSASRENNSQHIPTSSESSVVNEIGVSDFLDPRHIHREHDFNESIIVGEVIHKRTADSKTFIQADGMFVMQSFATAIHFFNGEYYQEIDNTINNNLGNTSNAFNVSFDSGSLVNLSSNQGSISITPVFDLQRQEADIFIYDGNLQMESSSRGEPLVQPNFGSDIFSTIQDLEMSSELQQELQTTLVRNNSAVTFANIFDGVDIQYTLQGQSLQESLIIHNPLGNYDFTFQLDLNNFDIRQNNEAIYILDRNGDIVYRIQTGYLVDVTGLYGVVSHNLEYQDGNYYLTISACEGFMSMAAFPVVMGTMAVTTTLFTSTSMRVGNYHAASSSHFIGTAHFRSNFERPGGFIPIGGRSYSAFVDINNIARIGEIIRDNYVVSAELSFNNSNPNGNFNAVLKATTNLNNMHDLTGFYTFTVESSSHMTFDIKNYVTQHFNQAIFSIRERNFNDSVFSNPVLRIQYSHAQPYYLSHNHGDMGTSLLDLNSGRLTYVFDTVQIQDGFMPIQISHVYNNTFSPMGRFHVGHNFRLNLHQLLQFGTGFTAFIDALGNRHYFINNQNERLGMRLYTQSANHIMVDRSGNSMVFASNGRLMEIHEFPSRHGARQIGMWLEINYLRTSGDIFQIANVTNGNTTVSFEYNSGGRVSRMTSRVGNATPTELVTFTDTPGGTTLHSISRNGHVTEFGYIDRRLNRVFQHGNDARSFGVGYDSGGRVNRLETHIRNAGGAVQVNSQEIVNVTYVTSNYVRTTRLASPNTATIRHVSFRGSRVVADYAWRGSDTVTATSNGFDVVAFTNTFARARDINISFSNNVATVNVANNQPNLNQGGVSNFVFSAWVRVSISTNPRVELRVNDRITTHRLNGNTTEWQYLAIAPNAQDVIGNSIRVELFNVVEIYDARLIRLPVQWDPNRANNFPRQESVFDQPARIYRFNPADNSLSQFNFVYTNSPGEARYPRFVQSITEYRAPATAQNESQFNQNRRRVARVEFQYCAIGHITRVREFGTGSSFHETTINRTNGGRTIDITQNGIRTTSTLNTNGSTTSQIHGVAGSPTQTRTDHFNVHGQLSSTTTGNITTNFGYNGRNQLSRITHNGFHTDFGYNNSGNLGLISIGDRNLMQFTYTSDQSRLRSITHGNGQQVFFGQMERDAGWQQSINGTHGYWAHLDHQNTYTHVEHSTGVRYYYTAHTNMHTTRIQNHHNVEVQHRAPNGGLAQFRTDVRLNNNLEYSQTVHLNGLGQVDRINHSRFNVQYTYDSLHRLRAIDTTFGGTAFHNGFLYHGNTNQVRHDSLWVNN